MPPRKKRLRSDDSENSTVDSKGPSSGSDIQKSMSGRNSRHLSKKVSSEDYDGDCELEQPGKNRVTRTATRSHSRVLKQKPTNSMNSDSSCSTPVTEMEVDLLGFQNLITPFSALSPMPGHLVSTPQGLTPGITTQTRGEPVVISTPKPLFETPVEKPVKKFKRKRVAKYRLSQVQNRTRNITEDEALMVAHFNEIDNHELLIE